LNLLTMIGRGLGARRTSTGLTALGVALGVMLISAMLAVGRQVADVYRNQGSAFPIILGAKGSALQLVLNVVYQLDQSPGLIPFSVYREMQNTPWVKLAVPYAVGDSYRGFRVVATTDAIFDPSFQPLPGRPLALRAGRALRVERPLLDGALARIEQSGSVEDEDDETAPPSDAVVGSAVAEHLGLRLGANIEPTHGIEGGKAHENRRTWTVVGILKPTATAIDRVIFIGLDSFFGIEEHLVGGRLPSSDPGRWQAALSAVVVFPRVAAARTMMLPQLNRRGDIQAASASREIRKLLQIVGDVEQLFVVLASGIVAVGVLSVAVALYNTMNERRREVAILRALGARRRTVLLLLVGEAAAIAAAGAVVGLGLGRALVFAVAPRIEAITGLAPDVFRWTEVVDDVPGLRSVPAEVLIPVAVAVVGALSGLLPGIRGYRTPVASNLGAVQ